MSILSTQTVYLIDKFFIPKDSIQELQERSAYARNFLKQLPGFISSEEYEQTDEQGNLTLITIANWQSMMNINNAKEAIQAEFKRINFNPAELYQRLNIRFERGIYTKTVDKNDVHKFFIKQ